MQSRKIIRVVLVSALILLIPFVAMLFSKDVKWSAMDFAVAGGILIITGLIFELLMARFKDRKSRLIAAGALLVAFMVLWVHLAVGIVDSWPLAGS